MTQINTNLNSKYNLKQKNPAFKSEQQHFPMQYQLPPEENYQNPVLFMPSMQPQEITQEQFIPTPESQLPSMYYDPNYNKEPMTFKDTLKKVDAFGAIYPWLEHPLLMAGTTVGTFWGFNKFTTAWGGEVYEKSLLGKVTKFGDNIANSKVFQNETSKNVLGGIQKGFNWVGKQLNKVQIFRAMKDTPLKPEWSMAAYETISQDQRIISEDFRRIVERLELVTDNNITIEKIGLKKSEHDVLKRVFNVQNISEISDEKQVIAALLKRLGKTDAEALQAANLGNASMATIKDEIRNLMGGVSKDRLEEIIKNCEGGNFADEVLEMAKKSKGKVWVGEGEYSWLGKKFQPFKRYIGMDNVFNRMHSMRVGEGAETQLGKIMSQAVQKIYRGFTFGGGKLGMLIFIVPHIVHAIMNTVKAERDEKIGTAVQNGIGVFSWVFTIPLATQLIYKLGGIRNAGLTPERVKEIDAKKATYHAGNYNGTRKQLKAETEALSKVDGQNLLTKMARKVAGFFTSDLGTIKPIATETAFVKAKGNLGNFMRNFGNVPLRFIAVFALMGVLDGLINKTLSAIFGRSHDEMEVEAHAEEKKAQKSFTKEDLHQRLLNANQAKLAASGGLNQVNSQENQIIQPLLSEEQYARINEQSEKVVEEDRPQLDPNVVKTNSEFDSLKPNRENQEKTNNVEQQKQYIPNQNVNPEVLASEPVESKDNYTYIPTPAVNPEIVRVEQKTSYDKHTYIPSSENKLGQEEQAKKLNRYIPSQEAANVGTTFDNSGLDGAFARADRAERIAIETLNGNFRML